MGIRSTFDEVLDAVEDLPIDQQSELVEVLRRRLAEKGRQRVVQDVREGRAEFAAGGSKAATVEGLMREIES
jgi:hypothetical protein